MPAKYRRRTPVAERVYRSSPGLVQQQFPSLNLRRRQRASIGTPLHDNRQSTLTQIEFITSSGRPKFANHDEIADSQDEDGEDDVYEARPAKRRRRNKDQPRKLIKQETLTQMDFLRLIQGDGLDNDDSEMPIQNGEEGDAAELANDLDSEQPTTRDNLAESPRPVDGIIVPAASKANSVSGDMPESSPHPTDGCPITPQKNRTRSTLEVPSSQSPPATPVSLPSVRSARRFYQATLKSPTPLRTVTKVRWADEAQMSRASKSPDDIRSPGRNTDKTPRTRHMARVRNDEHGEVQIRSPTSAASLRVSDFIKNSSSNTNKQSQHSMPLNQRNTNIETQTQTQTQTSPATKKRIGDFNSRWAALSKTAEYPRSPSKRGPPSRSAANGPSTPANLDFITAHESFAIGDETQLELSGQPVQAEQDDDVENRPISLRREGSFEIPHEAALNFDDADSSPPRVIESPMKVRPKRIFAVPSSQEEDNVASESQIDDIPVANIIQIKHRTPRFSSPIHASQATTIPCTPKSSQVLSRNATSTEADGSLHSAILVASTPDTGQRQRLLARTPSIDDEPDKSPSLPEYQSMDEPQVKRPAGISQLLPSSVLDSDVPLPPESLEIL